VWDPACVLGAVLAAALPPSLVIGLMTVAVLVAIFGHLTQIRGLIVSGILLLVVATGAMMLGGLGAWNDTPGPVGDPLRGDDRQLPPDQTFREARGQQR
jgi:hypothetical protein